MKSRYAFLPACLPVFDAEFTDFDAIDDGVFWPGEFGLADSWWSLVAWTVRLRVKLGSA